MQELIDARHAANTAISEAASASHVTRDSKSAMDDQDDLAMAIVSGAGTGAGTDSKAPQDRTTRSTKAHTEYVPNITTRHDSIRFDSIR